MPDWQKIVLRELAGLRLDDGDKQEVIEELADHLEDAYEALRRQGLPEDDAVRRALSQVQNWNDLQRKIRAAKEDPMNARTSRLWLPSLVTLALSLITLIVAGELGLKPGPLGSHALKSHYGIYVVSEYTVWLMALPFLGALGAYLSRRAGGTRRDIVISGVFPALSWMTILVLLLSVAASREHGLQASTAPLGPLWITAVLVLIPGACLLMGVLGHAALATWRDKPAR